MANIKFNLFLESIKYIIIIKKLDNKIKVTFSLSIALYGRLEQQKPTISNKKLYKDR
jgi:hypothetical protein